MAVVWRVELRESLSNGAVFTIADVVAKSATDAAAKAPKVCFPALGLVATKVELLAVAK